MSADEFSTLCIFSTISESALVQNTHNVNLHFASYIYSLIYNNIYYSKQYVLNFHFIFLAVICKGNINDIDEQIQKKAFMMLIFRIEMLVCRIDQSANHNQLQVKLRNFIKKWRVFQ